MLQMNKDMTNQQIADLLRDVAAVFEVMDDNQFRVRAYQNAATSIEHATSDIKDLWQEGNLGSLPGVGPSIKQHLDELFKSGKVNHFLTETKKVPQGMFELLKLPEVGPKTAAKLAHQFKLNNPKTAFKKLEAAARKNKIAPIEGFGEKTQTQILKAIENYQKPQDRILLDQAQRLADEVMAYLKASPLAQKVEVLGSFRRKNSTIGDLDFAVATTKPAEFMEYLKKYKNIKKILSTGPKTTMFIHSLGRQIDVKTQYPDKWGSILQHYTGSKHHNIHLRTYAKGKGYSLSEHGIKKGNKLKTFTSEKTFYNYLGLDYIPPELREDNGEIEAALKHNLPQHLVQLKDIKADFHLHTNIDVQTSHDLGANSVKEIIKKADSLGYYYIGLTDHNPKLSDLTPKKRLDLIKRRNDKIEQQITSYENSVKKRTVKVLKGLEIDIRPDGQLALEDAAIQELDYIIASVHSQFNQSQKKATQRILAALSHPKVKIFGHPTGRMLLSREGLDYDWDQVFSFCQDHHIAIEINASPARLDLPDTLIKQALKYNLMFTIDTDSHAVEHMNGMVYGVWTARRGWAESKHILNTHTSAQIKAFFSSK